MDDEVEEEPEEHSVCCCCFAARVLSSEWLPEAATQNIIEKFSTFPSFPLIANSIISLLSIQRSSLALSFIPSFPHFQRRRFHHLVTLIVTNCVISSISSASVTSCSLSSSSIPPLPRSRIAINFIISLSVNSIISSFYKRLNGSRRPGSICTFSVATPAFC
jgi:hypothetical protein